MDESLEERLAAVERTLTDGDHDCSALADAAATAEQVESLETQLAELDDRVAELEAATLALRGYVGKIRSVNTDVEQRADAAMAKAQAVHDAVSDGRNQNTNSDEGPGQPRERHEQVFDEDCRCEECGAPRHSTRMRADSPRQSRQTRLDRLRESSAEDSVADAIGSVNRSEKMREETANGTLTDGDDGLLVRIRDMV